METTTEIQQILESPVVQQLNEKVVAVLGSETMQGFQKAYIVADAIAVLKKLLTPEYMKPIMALQGSRLGFKTDKDKTGGYSEEVVKECLIDAVLSGVMPTGNQFNIIAGNMYITKEGFGHLLGKIPELNYTITFELPRIKDGSAAVVALIDFVSDGKTLSKRMDIPIRVNNGMGADAVIGKATRKARAWLHTNLSGIEFGDGDVSDINAEVVGSKINESVDKQLERVLLMIGDCKTPQELETLKASLDFTQATILDTYTRKVDELAEQAEAAEKQGKKK